MTSKDKNQRSEERVRAAVPVSLPGASGVTRDVSVSGIFFETATRYDVGNAVKFAIDMDAPGGHMILKCAGVIVRVEPGAEQIGVAVKITESALQLADP